MVLGRPGGKRTPGPDELAFAADLHPPGAQRIQRLGPRWLRCGHGRHRVLLGSPHASALTRRMHAPPGSALALPIVRMPTVRTGAADRRPARCPREPWPHRPVTVPAVAWVLP